MYSQRQSFFYEFSFAYVITIYNWLLENSVILSILSAKVTQIIHISKNHRPMSLTVPTPDHVYYVINSYLISFIKHFVQLRKINKSAH